MNNLNQIKVTVQVNGTDESFFVGLGNNLELIQLKNNINDLFKKL